jgi:hypothetical protein
MANSKLVDEYVISVVDTDGFKSLVVQFKTDDGSVERYAFPPLYAHKFADELTMASIRAVAT